MLFFTAIVALVFAIIQVKANSGPYWRSGGTVNTLFGIGVGGTVDEVYGAVYSGKDDVPKLYYSGDKTNYEIGSYLPSGGLALDVAVSKDGLTMCQTGGHIFCGVAGQSYQPAAINRYSGSVSLNIRPLGQSGFASIGTFPVNLLAGPVVNGVAYSRDGGVTWDASDIGLSRSAGYKARYGAFPTDNTWYVTSGDWPNSRQDNIGMNAARVSSRISIKPDVGPNGEPEVLFISARNLQGTYPGAISKTTDGGRTWTKVFDSNGKFYLNQIDCIDADNCAAVGEDGKSATVIITKDGGASWTTKMSLKGPFSLSAVRMMDANNIHVSGGTVSSGAFLNKEIVGNYYRTFDGGNTWTVSTFNGYGYDLDFYGGVGYASALFKSHTDIWTYR